LSEEKLRSLEGKRLVFIGFGNSTAEMLLQIQEYEAQTGREIDYRIITHYPEASIRDPFTKFGSYDSVYRDINKPNLVKLAGDLDHINTSYSEAHQRRKIISGIINWEVEGNQVVATDRDGIKTVIPYDQIYTLTGYRQEPESLERMGIQVLDDTMGASAFDYDGEVQANPGAVERERVYPGYFGIGPLTKTVYNPNAVVIPGIQYQLNDLLTTLVIRAAEYKLRRQS